MTYLYSYESLAEREQTIAKFMFEPERPSVSSRSSGELTEEISSRLLIPAAFAQTSGPGGGREGGVGCAGAAAPGADCARGARGGVCRSLSLGQLRLGGTGG